MIDRRDDEVGAARLVGDMLAGRTEGQLLPPLEVADLRQRRAKFLLGRRSPLGDHLQVMFLRLEGTRAPVVDMRRRLFRDQADHAGAEALRSLRDDGKEIRVRTIDAQTGEQGRKWQKRSSTDRKSRVCNRRRPASWNPRILAETGP